MSFFVFGLNNREVVVFLLFSKLLILVDEEGVGVIFSFGAIFSDVE